MMERMIEKDWESRIKLFESGVMWQKEKRNKNSMDERGTAENLFFVFCKFQK